MADYWLFDSMVEQPVTDFWVFDSIIARREKALSKKKLMASPSNRTATKPHHQIEFWAKSAADEAMEKLRESELNPRVEKPEEIQKQRQQQLNGEIIISPIHEVTHDDNAVYVKVYMPGVSKERVKLLVHSDFLEVEGEVGDKDWEEDLIQEEEKEEKKRYATSIHVDGYLKIDQVEATMKDDVLEVVVLRLKNSVFNVNID